MLQDVALAEVERQTLLQRLFRQIVEVAGRQAAVPLADVLRIEQLKVSRIEYIGYRPVLHHLSLEGQGERVVDAAPYAAIRDRVAEIWRQTFE